MFFFIIIGIIFVFFILILDKAVTNSPKSVVQQQSQYDLTKYEAKQYIMTQTELKFYRELKKITDELECSIFPQVDLERIIKVSDNNSTDRNRIKSRSIDYTIVNNKNCRIIACIELDDYTHNRATAKKADDFKNMLFEKVNIPLHRVPVNNYYDTLAIKSFLENDIKKVSSYN